ncbi:MAG: hypothetical protein FWB99_09740 [Treponema sp.]|nr:hypothetical protein [Treponema sp.]
MRVKQLHRRGVLVMVSAQVPVTESAWGLTFKPHGTDITKEKNRVRKEAEALVREFSNNGFAAFARPCKTPPKSCLSRQSAL